MAQVNRDSVYAAALAAASSDGAPLDGADRLVLLHIDSSDGEARILARRLTRDWVDVGALFGRGDEVDLDAGVGAAIDALWPECTRSARRMLAVIAHGVSRFGGSLFTRRR